MALHTTAGMRQISLTILSSVTSDLSICTIPSMMEHFPSRHLLFFLQRLKVAITGAVRTFKPRPKRLLQELAAPGLELGLHRRAFLTGFRPVGPGPRAKGFINWSLQALREVSRFTGLGHSRSGRCMIYFGGMLVSQ